MTFTYKLNDVHDLSIVDGKIVTIAGPEQVRQRVIIALLHNWKEYFLNVNDGVPWYESILGSKSKKNVELILRRAILDVPGVIGVANFQLIPSSTNPRGLSIYSDIEVEGPLDSEVISVETTINLVR